MITSKKENLSKDKNSIIIFGGRLPLIYLIIILIIKKEELKERMEINMFRW